MLTLQCKKGDDNDATTDAVSSYSWAIPPWSIVGQRGWLEGLHADTRGAAPFFLETPASSVFSVVFSSTGCQNGKEGRSADHRVLGRGQHSIARSAGHRGAGDTSGGTEEMRRQTGHVEVHPGAGSRVRGRLVPGSTRGLICVTFTGAPRVEPAPSGLRGTQTEATEPGSGGGWKGSEMRSRAWWLPGWGGGAGAGRRPQSGFQAEVGGPISEMGPHGKTDSGEMGREL